VWHRPSGETDHAKWGDGRPVVTARSLVTATAFLARLEAVGAPSKLGPRSFVDARGSCAASFPSPPRPPFPTALPPFRERREPEKLVLLFSRRVAKPPAMP